MVQWLFLILIYDFAILKFSFCEVTLSLRLLHYKNRNGLTYENRPCDSRLEHDINRDGRCDTGFLFCLVRLPFQNPHNCTLGDHFTGFVGADDIHFVNIDHHLQRSAVSISKKKQRSSLISLWFQPTIYFHFKYPKTGFGLIVEVFDIDDAVNQTIHDSIDFYGRTLLDVKLSRSVEVAQPHRIYLRSLFGTYTNLTADFSLYCSLNYYGNECETYCSPNKQRYQCDRNTGQKICKDGYFGQDCLSDVRACEDQPCLNNGTCVVYLGTYLCQCQLGVTGRSCEIGPSVRASEELCDRTKCIHGDCSRSGKCICHNGWTSKNCNQTLIIRETNCASRPCLHNSTCESLFGINSSLTYRCHCRAGYTGRNCEVAIVTSCERTPCIHGQCIKIDLYTEICICEESWIGVDCSEAVSTPAMITYTPIVTKKLTPITTSRVVKNLTQTPFTTDLSDYFDWLKKNNEIIKATKAYHLVSKTPILHKNNDSPCSSSPCLHNSTCVMLSGESFRCLCSSSFIGIYCEIEILNIAHFRTNPCESSPCQHQSICITKSNQEVQCICRPHYSGKYCENAPPLVTSSSSSKCTRVCQNDGLCVIDESNQEHCICKPSYGGSSCELTKKNCNGSSCSIDSCRSNPCLFNGTCHSIINSTNYTCSCPEEHTGERCEFLFESDSIYALSRDNLLNDPEILPKHSTDLWPLAIVFGYVFSLMLVFIIIWFLWYGVSNRPQSYFRSEIPRNERSTDRYQSYRLGVSNPLFFSNQEHHPNSILKTFDSS